MHYGECYHYYIIIRGVDYSRFDDYYYYADGIKHLPNVAVVSCPQICDSMAGCSLFVVKNIDSAGCWFKSRLNSPILNSQITSDVLIGGAGGLNNATDLKLPQNFQATVGTFGACFQAG
jgi:hypothetical protein